MRQASQRLAIAAFGVVLGFACALVINNALHLSSRPGPWNVVAGAVVGLSGVVGWQARSGRLAPKQVAAVSLAYEVAVALGISIGDNLEPLPRELPLASISWLCVWIAVFPLVIPARPRWTLAAGFAAASTWPLAYGLGLAIGNPPAPLPIALLNFLENYIAVALALFTTAVMRRLHELGCYQLVERFDHGGMGEIWRARHVMLARPVAVKLIRPELLGAKSATDADALVGRFRREAEATAALHSPHTVTLHDFGMTPDGVFYYVMELLDGLDLESLVERFGPTPPARAVHLLRQACDSLAEAHAAGLVHRDIKPANLVACRSGVQWDFVKVLDFGLVKATWSLGEDELLTNEGAITGTPAYIAPETALGGRPVDARVDIYGLGCVAYWLLTGERVFTGRTPMEVLMHHVKTPPVPPSQRAQRPIPASLESLVLACLAKEPDDRPASAEALAESFAACACAVDAPWTAADARDWWQQRGLASSRSPVETRG